MGTNYPESLRLSQGDLTVGVPDSHHLPRITHGASKLQPGTESGPEAKISLRVSRGIP